MALTEGQMSDYQACPELVEGGAAIMFDALSKARELIADKGYDGNWLRQALAASLFASRPNPTAKWRSRTTPSSIANATRSRSRSAV